MSVLKRTYSLPENILQEFESVVPPGDRSGVLAELLREWIEGRNRNRLRQAVIEGCRDMADVYLQTEAEFHRLEEEVHRAIQP